jgi:hypothetical protein
MKDIKIQYCVPGYLVDGANELVAGRFERLFVFM